MVKPPLTNSQNQGSEADVDDRKILSGSSLKPNPDLPSHAKIKIADIQSIDLMLLNELTPILKELTKEPIAFCNGFVSGILRLDLNDDPLKTWLERQAGYTPTNTRPTSGNDREPQSIEID